MASIVLVALVIIASLLLAEILLAVILMLMDVFEPSRFWSAASWWRPPGAAPQPARDDRDPVSCAPCDAAGPTMTT
jgi:hypothetical protein